MYPAHAFCLVLQLLNSGTVVNNSGPEMQFMWKMRECLIGGTYLLVRIFDNVCLCVVWIYRCNMLALLWLGKALCCMYMFSDCEFR